MRQQLWIFLLCGALVANAEDEGEVASELPEIPGTVECVSLARIDRTRVVSDSAVLFYMQGQGDNIYVNNLPRKCNGLKRADALSWSTSLSRLCNVDVISGLRRSGGSFLPGVRCGLGKFVPIDAAGVDLLLAEPALEPDAESGQPEIQPPADEAAGDKQD